MPKSELVSPTRNQNNSTPGDTYGKSKYFMYISAILNCGQKNSDKNLHFLNHNHCLRMNTEINIYWFFQKYSKIFNQHRDKYL